MNSHGCMDSDAAGRQWSEISTIAFAGAGLGRAARAPMLAVRS